MKMRLKLDTIIFVLPVLAACAHAPRQEVVMAGHPAAIEESQANLPQQELTEQVLFGLLLAPALLSLALFGDYR